MIYKFSDKISKTMGIHDYICHIECNNGQDLRGIKLLSSKMTIKEEIKDVFEDDYDSDDLDYIRDNFDVVGSSTVRLVLIPRSFSLSRCFTSAPTKSKRYFLGARLNQ